MRSNNSEWGLEGAGSSRSLKLSIPVQQPELFKHKATSYILNFLSDNPEINLSIRQLSKVTPVSERSTKDAVDVLEDNNLIKIHQKGNARRVQINRDILDNPSDPISKIPQSEYRTPVRIAKTYLKEKLNDIKGLVLFGSVARGQADKKSDIDLWILIEKNLFKNRNEANVIAKDLGDLHIPETIGLNEAKEVNQYSDWESIFNKLESPNNKNTAGSRYSYQFIVEIPKSVTNQSSRIDPEKLFGEGITLISSPALKKVKKEVVQDE